MKIKIVKDWLLSRAPREEGLEIGAGSLTMTTKCKRTPPQPRDRREMILGPETGMRRHVFLFFPRFAWLVESGVKCQTVRSVRKRRPEPGDLADLRQWTGKPRRSKQRHLKEGIILKILPVRIERDFSLGWTRLMINDIPLSYPEQNVFARADGFRNWREMYEWFQDHHGLPFKGIVIYWKP